MSLTDTYDKRVATAAAWFNDAQLEVEAARAELRAALELRRQRGGRQQGQCGTPAGYRNHMRYGTYRCPACTEAWNWSVNHGRRQVAA